jgi:hypothetical protein
MVFFFFSISPHFYPVILLTSLPNKLYYYFYYKKNFGHDSPKFRIVVISGEDKKLQMC